MDNFIKANISRIKMFDQNENFVELRRDAVCPNNIHSDLWIIRQKDRLDALGDDLVNTIKARFAERTDISNPFEGMSDADILDNIKSRNIQTAAELKNYLLVLQNVKDFRLNSLELSPSVTETNKQESKTEES